LPAEEEVAAFQKFREHWVRPALFFGNNPISLLGGAITTAAGVTMIGYWLMELFGRGRANPYVGIIFLLILPALFILGLLLIPIGIIIRHRKLRKAGLIPAQYPKIDLNDRIFRHGLDIVLVATIVNLLVVAMASYRGAAYMDSPQFCGQSCHVMHPEYTAYRISPHSHVDCVECHIGSGAQAYFNAKVNGAKQLIEMILGRYPRPIPSPVQNLRPARYTCEGCHTPTRFVGERLLVRSNFADDAQNTETQTVLVLHLGGEDSLSRRSGIHGVHLNHMEYIATDQSRSTIPWVMRRNDDGSETVFTASALKGAKPSGDLREMDCIDCHNRAAHSFVTPEQGMNRAMADGAISTELPYIKKKGVELLKTEFASQDEARAKIPAQLEAFYRSEHPEVLSSKADLVKAAGNELVKIYTQNVFPDMNVTWGTRPNNIGHMDYPGCFRCHDGDHTSKDGKTITQDCSNCHNLLAVEEAKPKVLSDLGL
jgi:nitrate/TMAO reductase-like tetraheme cytochrome c subunit